MNWLFSVIERLNRYSSCLVLHCCHCGLGWPPFLWVKLRKNWILTHHATQYHQLVHLSKCYKCTFSKSLDITPEHFLFSILEDTLLFHRLSFIPTKQINLTCCIKFVECPCTCALCSHQIQDATSEHCGLECFEHPLQADSNPTGCPWRTPFQPHPVVCHTDLLAL